MKADNQQQTAPKARGFRATFIVLLLFIAVLGVLLGLWAQRQASRREAIQERQQYNMARGLAVDYPSQLVPVYPGVEILETDRGEGRSTDGEPMDRWYVRGGLDIEPQVLYDYYSQLMLNKGLTQTVLMALPTGYGVNYGSGSAIHEGTHREGMEQPHKVWVPSIGTSGLAIYEGDQFPNWRGSFLAGGLSGTRITLLGLDGTDVVREETLVQGLGQIGLPVALFRARLRPRSRISMSPYTNGEQARPHFHLLCSTPKSLTTFADHFTDPSLALRQ